MPLTVRSLHYYPIKSCAGIDLENGQLDARGLKLDRGWMVTGEDGKQLTQRDIPAMALIRVEVRDGGLILTAIDMPALKVPVIDGTPREVQVWDDRCIGIDQGDDVAAWLTSFLKQPCRLVRMDDSFKRRVDPERLPDREFLTRFADGYPLLLISQSSLDVLNDKLDIPVQMNRFRPNIVIDGCNPFEEDRWKLIEINGIRIRIVKPCARCTLVTVDQEDASTGKEPLRTLAAFRKKDGKVLFGQNLAHEQPGTLAIGDTVTVLEQE